VSNVHDISYYRQRARNRVWEVVVRALEQSGKRKKDIAEFLGVPPSQISRWLSGPGNWEIDTATDLLLASGAEMDFQAARFADRPKPNYHHQLNAPVHSEIRKSPPSSASSNGTLHRTDFVIRQSRGPEIARATVAAR